MAYGRHAYGTTGEMKSVEGSLAFFIVAFLATGGPLLLFTETRKSAEPAAPKPSLH